MNNPNSYFPTTPQDALQEALYHATPAKPVNLEGTLSRAHPGEAGELTHASGESYGYGRQNHNSAPSQQIIDKSAMYHHTAPRFQDAMRAVEMSKEEKLEVINGLWNMAERLQDYRLKVANSTESNREDYGLSG